MFLNLYKVEAESQYNEEMRFGVRKARAGGLYEM